MPNPDPTTPTQPSEAQLRGRAAARAKRRAMQTRAQRIRRSVAGLTALLFVAAFLVVYVQLASGHDPALVADAKRHRATSGLTASAGSSKDSTKAAARRAAARRKAAAEKRAAERRAAQARAEAAGAETSTTEAGSETSAEESSGESSSEPSSSSSSSSSSESSGESEAAVEETPSSVSTSQS